MAFHSYSVKYFKIHIAKFNVKLLTAEHIKFRLHEVGVLALLHLFVYTTGLNRTSPNKSDKNKLIKNITKIKNYLRSLNINIKILIEKKRLKENYKAKQINNMTRQR